MHTPKPRVTLIVGGMYGSEGKGKVAGYLASEFDIAVRIGAPNAGHSLKVGDNIWKMQQIPVAGLVNPDIDLCIGPAGLINLDILAKEMAYIQNIGDRLFIDRNAGILEHAHQLEEEQEKMFEGIGSTCEGCGAALKHKISRKLDFRLAIDIPELGPFITNVAHMLNNADKKKIMIEGTQGFMLSLNHGNYPFVTSRDIIASSLLSDTGLAPSLVEDIIMVIRTYPIRVAGNSGPMCGKEISWDIVKERGQIPYKLKEQTTVTKRTRRVCEFDIGLIKKACLINRPTQIALMFADYVDYPINYGKQKYEELSIEMKSMIDKIEENTGVPVTLIGTGFDFEHMVDRRKGV